MAGINFAKIEKKWQKKWEDGKVFEAKDNVKGSDEVTRPIRRSSTQSLQRKKKYYVLDMFPYPSGAGLHIGHAFAFSLGDIVARFKRMQGFNVLYPVGYDSLGLPAENAAIKAKTHPEDYTKKSIANFMKQQKAMGWSYDWSRMVKTSDPSFYRWDQWIFLKMLEKGLAYQKEAAVNWCPKCNTVLANEQVTNGCCWRHEDTEVEIKHLKQWFLKITDYVEELISGLDKVDWPDRAKKLQRNWIGKSFGTQIDFRINGEKWQVFTTRPDTIYGVTFMVVSAQHVKLMGLVTKEQKKEVEKFLKKLKSVSEKELEGMEKEGVFTGSYALNPINGEKVPVYAGNFVLAEYGCGMVMAVPAHDQRDFEFAKKYGIEIRQVIVPKGMTSKGASGDITNTRAYTGEGSLVNSDRFNGVNSKKAIEGVTKHLGKIKAGKKTVNYKLRDWLISRQRYWGTPIPVIYCDKCGAVPVPEKDLPIVLPKKVKFGKGNPLEGADDWVNVKCPKCSGKARRETDTMDTFANSSWYYLRYCDAHNDKKIFDVKKVGYWCPVDQYIGGPEHITMHLIYVRFYTKFLRDIGLLKFDEPALRYFTQGIVHGADGEKMSKSRGNVVEPLEMIEKYGADTLRMALVSLASPDNDSLWDEKMVFGTHKFLKRVYNYFYNFKAGKTNAIVVSKLNKAIKEVTDYVGNFKHNLAVIKIRQLFDSFADEKIDKDCAEKFLKLLHVYCPHLTEELWEKIGGKGFISVAKWPVADEKKIDESLEQQEAAIDKLVDDINHVVKLVGKKVKKAYVYVIPKAKDLYEKSADFVKKKTGLLVEVFSVSDKNKHDPEGKSKKVKPGRPGIYLE